MTNLGGGGGAQNCLGKCDFQTRKKLCQKKKKRGFCRYFLDHPNVLFGVGDDVGVCVAGHDTDHSLRR